MNDYNIVVLAATPSPDSHRKRPVRRDLSTFRFVAFSVVFGELFDCPTFCAFYSRAHSFIFSARCLGEYSVVFRGRSDIDLFRMRLRVRFNRTVARYGSVGHVRRGKPLYRGIQFKNVLSVLRARWSLFDK